MPERRRKRWLPVLLLLLLFACGIGTARPLAVKASALTEAKEVSGGKWVKSSSGYMYRYSNGTYAKNVWLKISGKIYRINEKGILCKGWFTWNKHYYYADKNGRLLYKRVLTIGSDKYYLNADGTRATKQWQKISGKYYYFMYNGKLAKNCFVGEYFVNAKGVMLRSSWLKKSGKRYYFAANGKRLKKTWFKYKNKFYYFKADATMAAKQWIRTSKGYRYVKADGTMALKQWIKTSKGYYYVNASGYKMTNCIVGGYYLDKTGLRTVKPFKGERIFVGDSRIVGMESAACSKTQDLCIAKVGMGYSWLESTAGPLLKQYLNINPDVKVILAMGVNDVQGNVNKYIAYYRKLIAAYPKTQFYFLSVNPVIEKQWPSVKNSWIEAFNEKIKAAFPDRYIDCYTYMVKKKFKTTDGLHYAATTYQAIYKFILTKLV